MKLFNAPLMFRFYSKVRNKRGAFFNMKKMKDFFATPKKAVITSVCLVAGVGVLATGSVFAAGAIARGTGIGTTKAEDIALKDAGTDFSQARVYHTQFDFDDGHYIYEVEFTANGMEYDYRIKSSNGKILSRSSEPMEGYAANAYQNQNAAAAQQNQNAGADQSQNAAPAAAQNQNAGADQSQNTAPATAQNQNAGADQGQNAAAAQQPVGNQGAVPNAAAATIDIEEAKRIALDHAGLSADEVKYMNAYLEYDDGIEQYEIQFYKGTTEYEYSIDAVNGTVLGYNMESIFG